MFEAFMPQAQDPNVAGPSLEELRKRKLMAELLQGRRGPPKIEHPLQGVAHILDSALTGYREGQENKRQRAQDADTRSIMAELVRGTGGGPAVPASSAAPASPAPTAPSATGTAPAAPTAAPSTSPRPVAFQGSQQDFVAQMMPHALRVSQQTGIDPRIVIAQSALESGWGRSAPGNNFFGIKSHGQPGGNTLATTEVVNGQPVRTQDSFRAYADMGESADGYARFLQQNPRYRPMLQAQGLDAQIQALGASGYATDPNYAAKIRSIAGGISLPQQRAEVPADTLTGSDGMEAPPLVDGRNLPPDTQEPALGRPAMSFDEAMPPPDPAPPSPIQAGPDPQAIAQALMSAPVPEPRPPAPAPSVDNMMAGDQVVPQGAPMQAPMPQPRPNLEPPPQAMPAGPAPQPPPQAIAQALAPQMNERDRLMLLRDEQSLAPGEADRLRQGLANPQALAAVLQGRPAPMATPAPGPAQMPAQQTPQPQGVPQQMQAPQGMPPGGPQAMPQMQGPPGQIPDQLLLRMMNNPQTRAFATQEIQRRAQQNTPQAQAQLRRDQAQAAIAERDASGRAPTPRITEYEFYARQARERGATPDPFEVWDRANRRDGANSTTVNTGGSDKQIFDAVNESATAARSAATGLVAIQQARRAVEGGGIFGAGADMRLGLQKVASQLGLANPEAVINTETFQAAIAPQVAAMLKATVGTANISNSDREFAERAAGGRISLDQGSITRLLDIMERGNRTVLETHQKRLDTIYPPTGPHQRERALFGVEVPQAPAGGPRRISSQEEFNSLPSGTEFVAPDGTVRRKP